MATNRKIQDAPTRPQLLKTSRCPGKAVLCLVLECRASRWKLTSIGHHPQCRVNLEAKPKTAPQLAMMSLNASSRNEQKLRRRVDTLASRFPATRWRFEKLSISLLRLILSIVFRRIKLSVVSVFYPYIILSYNAAVIDSSHKSSENASNSIVCQIFWHRWELRYAVFYKN